MPNTCLILVVGQGSPLYDALPQSLDEPKARLIKVGRIDEVFRFLKKKAVKLVVLCLDVLGAEGLRLIDELKRRRPDTGIVIVNKPKGIRLSVEGMKRGVLADFYLPLEAKVFLDELRGLLRKSQKLSSGLEQAERSFAAVAFAEANERDWAGEILKDKLR